ncbi:TPA: DUF3973 domain-containing protein [Bacillus pseudomycoides]|nr:DUF3973 domain-containing protein [Bacillus pseudomycoides]
MYYCIVCSQLQNEEIVKSEIFENGFYIDPFLGEKVHLGMCIDTCGKKASLGNKQEKITENATQKKIIHSQKIMDYLPIHYHNKHSITL